MSQQFAVLQSMWAMERHHIDGFERSIEENIAMIVEAGFDGISVLCNERNRDDVRETASIINGQKLVVEAMCTIKTSSELAKAVENAISLGAHHLNVQANVHPHNVGMALDYLDAWRPIIDDAPLPVLFETHRDRLTNDLFLTLEMLDRLPDLRLLADLSHYVVSREFAWPISDETHAFMQRILDRSWAMHGRVASSQQIQVEIGYAHHRPWLDLFLTWWQYGIESWRRRAAPDDTLCFTCEIGPKPYAIAGQDGNDSVDRWEEAKLLMTGIRRVWRESCGAAGR
jgi:hypothetical protein